MFNVEFGYKNFITNNPFSFCQDFQKNILNLLLLLLLLLLLSVISLLNFNKKTKETTSYYRGNYK
jgi:hypothetical protein